MSKSDLQNDSEFSTVDRLVARQSPVDQHGDGESGRRGDVPLAVELNGVELTLI